MAHAHSIRNRSETRIASVQHGDYLGARRRLASGGAENCGSQRYSVDALERTLAGSRYLVVYLDGPESYETEGLSQYVGVELGGARWHAGGRASAPRKFFGY
jgi:hypothetical protein